MKILGTAYCPRCGEGVEIELIIRRVRVDRVGEHLITEDVYSPSVRHRCPDIEPQDHHY